MFYCKLDKDLSLKQIELKDAESIFRLTFNSRDYLREWLPWLDQINTVEDTLTFIENCLKGQEENKSFQTVIILNQEIVGLIGINEINWRNKTAYMGYWLAKEYQGNGIMTKAVKALIDYALKKINLNKVEIRAAVGNQKSRAIPERLGFVNEGCIRQAEWLYDHYVDHIIYGILSDEWKGIRK